MTRLLIATRNAGKLEEMRRIVAALPELADVRVIGLDDVPVFDEVPETGATFAANAVIKARDAWAHTGLVSVADDSGIALDALNGMPGVLSARWSGRPKDDERNIDLVLEQVLDVPDERLGAAFHCAVAVAFADGSVQTVDGVMPGRLIRQRRGTNGFGYDPIFVPSDQDGELTSAEMSAADKDAISHRGRALRAAVPLLVQAVGA